jgi:16S rRNA (guanine(966)-N(2))-methyltransferase RsmD
MRVIGGEFRSRRLKSLPGSATRPTPDRLRETLFDVLATRVRDCVFLDIYAGTGAVGIEALSRGARRCFFIEKNRAASELIRENITALGLQNRAEIFTSKLAPVLERVRADIAFLDPPYELTKEYETAMAALDRVQAPLVIVQHSSYFELQPDYGALHRYRAIKQGTNVLAFYQRQIHQDHDEGHSGDQ